MGIIYPYIAAVICQFVFIKSFETSGHLMMYNIHAEKDNILVSTNFYKWERKVVNYKTTSSTKEKPYYTLYSCSDFMLWENQNLLSPEVLNPIFGYV